MNRVPGASGARFSELWPVLDRPTHPVEGTALELGDHEVVVYAILVSKPVLARPHRAEPGIVAWLA